MPYPLMNTNSSPPVFDEDVYTAISLKTCVEERSLPGGPAEKAVLASIEKCEAFIKDFAF